MSQRQSLPRLQVMTNLDSSSSQPQDHLIQAIASTLSIPLDDILLFDSFSELGGDQDSAQQVCLACRSKGLDVSGKDILDCPTLAELQTRITPRGLSLSSCSSNSDDSSGGTYYSSYSSDEPSTQGESGRAAGDDGAVESNLSSLRLSFPTVSAESNKFTGLGLACCCMVVTPRAGPFDGQSVALIRIDSVSGFSPITNNNNLSPAESHLAKSQISLLRMEHGPQIWIPIDQSPNDKRALQTWVQNMDSLTYKEVMKLQIPARRSRVVTRKRSTLSPMDINELEGFCLSPMQQLYFQGNNDSIEGTWTKSAILNVQGGAEPADVDAAIDAVVARHSMLRVRFRQTEGRWEQCIYPTAPSSYHLTHHVDIAEDEIRDLVDDMQASINPTNGPAFAAMYVHNQERQMLYLAAHQLALDDASWKIVLSDLDELLQKGTLLSGGSASFKYWTKCQSRQMAQRLFEPTLPFEVYSANLEYWALTQESNTFGNSSRLSFNLSPEQAYSLEQSSAQVLRTDVSDIFLAALLLSFCQVFPERNLPTLWKREDGRDGAESEFNILETVGWFASLCPIGVSIDSETDLIQAIILLKDTRRAIPRFGVPFFTSEFATSQGASANVPLEIVFKLNDTAKQLQRQNGLFEPVAAQNETAGLKSTTGPNIGRIALFEISAALDTSGAQIDIVYNNTCRHQDKIQTWIRTFQHHVFDAITRLHTHEPHLTLSDIPLLQTSYQSLGRLCSDRRVNVKDIETIYPVTPAQQEILIAQAQNTGSYHCHAVYEMAALQLPFDVTRLCEAWEVIVSNTPALRSIFIDAVSREGLFDQAVLRKISPSILFIETTDPDDAVITLPAMNTSFGEPRHRLAVCYNPMKMIMRLDASQAICDLPSLHLLIAELTRVFSSQNPQDNSSLHNTYLHHISSVDTAYSLEVWKISLSNAKPCIFPSLSSAGNSTSHTCPFGFDISRTQIEFFCQQNNIAADAIFQLAWALVLRAFVGTQEVTFGYQFNARDEDLLCGITSLVGSFATLLPCFVDLSASQSLGECLVSISETFSNAQRHDNITLTEIQHALGLKEKTLFNTCLYFETPEELNTGDELTAVLVTSGRKTDCDVSLTLMFVDEYLRGDLTSPCLSASQVQSVMSSFHAALSHILESPDKAIVEADLLTDKDYASLVVQDWEFVQQSQKVSACLHDVILQHSLTRPNAPAVCSWDGDITYVQLATLVQRLKTYLVNLGVGPGTVVPVVLEKNHWAPVIILAVLQAGASFAPLDCQDPATAKSTIDYLNPHVVLATETAWKDLSTLAINLVIINDTFFAMLTPYVSAIGKDATPDHAACIFVTPKKSRSIFFTHASLLSTFIAQAEPFKLNSESRVLQLSAFNVDISLVEILGTLVHGGCVCVPHPHDRAHDVAGAMARMDVTWSYMTSLLARKINPDAVPSLRTLCFRTRRLDPDTYMPWLEDHDVLVAYGAPDICPLGISVTAVTKHSNLNVISPPVTGRFWVLNPDNPKKLMPVGAIGELAIDSPLATPHRFALDKPLQAPETYQSTDEKPRARYLKTGHRVRYLDDGTVQFISSVRDEVKVGGSNVDVAQVEQIMRRCLGTGIDVVVDSITTRDSGPLLAAFLEFGPHVFQPNETLRDLSPETREKTYIAKKMFETALESSAARDRLPRHCIPSVFIPVQSFPMSTSLKVNRRKLQRMVSDISTHDVLHMSRVPNPGEIQRIIISQKPLPITGPEETMREHWASVIGVSVSAIKGSSSFFSVGGNKYLAAQLVVACRKAGLYVSLTDLLGEASLTEICRSSESSTRKQPKIKTLAAKKLDMRFVKDVIAPQLHCSSPDVLDFAEASAQQVQALELGMFRTRADIVCLALRFNGHVDPSRLETACRSLAKMHAILNVAFVTHEHRMYQVHCASSTPPFMTISCPPAALDDATQNIVRENQNLSFDPAVPVTKFTFLNGDTQGSLIIRLSKTQIDDVAAHLLIHDLASLYDGDSTQDIPRSSYLDYTRASRVSYQQGLEYWNCQLDNAKMTKIIASTRPVPPASVSEIRTLKQTTSLGHLAPYGMTPDAALKAAWAIVLSTISSTHDVLFGEAIQSSSPSPDIIGPMSNILPVRVQFPPSHSTPLDLMNCIQLQRQSHARHEAFGIQELVSKCTPWRSCTRFSTIVQNYVPGLLDGSSTMNVHGATFTYRMIEAWTKDFPDLFVRSTVEANDVVTLEIKYSEERLSHSFVQSCLSLLVAAWETLTHPDMIHQPMIHSSDEIARSERKIPFPARHSPPVESNIDSAQRKQLQESIVSVWTKVINPSPSIPKNKLPSTPFYSISQTILPAHTLASELNSTLSLSLTAEDILAHPSMNAQLDLIAGTLPPKHTPSILSTLKPKPAQDRSLRASLRSFKNRNSVLSLRTNWIKTKRAPSEISDETTAPATIMEEVPTIVIPEIGSSDTPVSINNHLVELDAGPVTHLLSPVQSDDRRSSGGSSRMIIDEVSYTPSPRMSTWGSRFELPRRGTSPMTRR
ncbi:hypothetical protein FGSG_10523 [Fusarium graminearum PH-1]|uniref:Chromosome 1, complete genome n=1 Tax=Gibberella zeae (strain ATCC MYA-4620 / CBS 123657 / FGSC 9075 / NRRL 31084 / PH-1) TaxID=229533 RepID=I1S1C3_GIBZE|nr:hypothetical protein FGSG_10523 [Fusarium graminearum PH-1]ESU17254.1 hypothetical protein FGSG_10523 [Fusarium graminearum PH-1]CEF75966.1 unnamed protein product [Fusarium graminearum]|eukprot:XP_011319516.1 hypothetical protein FGSG_10523 [Fusarium graminearum PH-1]